METKRKQITVRQITPHKTDRAVFIGQTGSGKSTLARRLLRSRFNVWVLDVNATLDWHLPDSDYPEGEYLRVTSIQQLLEQQKYPKILFQPPVEQIDDFDLFNTFFKTAFLAGDPEANGDVVLTVYVDEAYAVTKAQIIPPYYKFLLVRGRGRGVETWTASQRPSGIPSYILSESEHSYLFKLKFPADTEKMEKMTGFDAEYIRKQPKRQFCYTDGDVTLYKLQLNLSTNNGK